MRITPEMNERLTRVSAGTPMGETYRRYWLPACLVEEVTEPDCPPIRVRLLGEDLVAFRDSSGAVGVLDAYCAHRRAHLFFGRNEECGLRCVYHGWKYDVSGRCVDMPNEQPYSKFKMHVSVKSYPTWEAGGIVWTYMGPTELMPPTPDYEFLRAPGNFSRVSKTGEECNWLQAVEGGIDTAHSSFAHNNDLSSSAQLRGMDTHPTLEVDDTDFGFTYASLRRISDETIYLRVYQFALPALQMRASFVDWEGNPSRLPAVNGHFWVPIDDENTWVYNYKLAAEGDTPIDDETWDRLEHHTGRGKQDYIPGTYWLQRNVGNDFLIDREMQRTRTFTGIEGINTQDFAIQTSMGRIVDRSKEALGSTDRAIQAARRLLIEAMERVERGEAPRGVDPESYRGLRATEMFMRHDADWRDEAKDGCVARW